MTTDRQGWSDGSYAYALTSYELTGNTTLAGSDLVLAIAAYAYTDVTLSVESITDSSGTNVWTFSTAANSQNPPAAGSWDSAGGQYGFSAIAYCLGAAAITSVTVTIAGLSATASNDIGLSMEEFTGAPAGLVATGASSAVLSSGVLTYTSPAVLAAAGGIVVANCASDTGPSSVGGSWTLEADPGATGEAWLIPAAAGGVSATWTWGSDTDIQSGAILALSPPAASALTLPYTGGQVYQAQRRKRSQLALTPPPPVTASGSFALGAVALSGMGNVANAPPLLTYTGGQVYQQTQRKQRQQVLPVTPPGGVGSFALGALAFSGTANVSPAATGSFALGALAFSGTATETEPDTGSFALGALGFSGTASVIVNPPAPMTYVGGQVTRAQRRKRSQRALTPSPAVTATGSFALGAVALSGTGNVANPVTTSGGLALGALAFTGTGGPATSAPLLAYQGGQVYQARQRKRRQQALGAKHPDITTGGFKLGALAFSGTASVAHPFPAFPIGVKVELLINGTWEDISGYVQNRSDITIDHGLPDESPDATPTSMTLVLDNRTGDFSPKNTSGAWYPYLTRNTQVRTSIAATSATGTAYSGYRFWGEISSFPPQWDVTGNDQYLTITASGPLRRFVQASPLGSPITQALLEQSGNDACVGLWPCEDLAGSAQLASALPGGPPLTFSEGTSTLADSSPFAGATLPLPEVGTASWSASVPSYTSNGAIVVRFLADLDVGTLPTDPTYGTALVAFDVTGGTLTQVVMCAQTEAGSVGLILYDGITQKYNSGPVFPPESTGNPTGTGEVPLWWSVEITASGGTVTAALRSMAPGDSSEGTECSTTFSGTVGNVSSISTGNSGMSDTILGEISIQSALVSLSGFTSQLAAYSGEYAADRISRLCSANGLNFTLVGTGTDTPLMGPQQIDTLPNILQSCSDMDRGQLYETRDSFGIGYRTRVSMQNQDPAVTAYYADSTLSAVPQPVEDDQYVVNYLTLTRNGGSSAVYALASGAMSTQNPPNGVGLYSDTETAYAYADTQLPNLAQWIVTIATVDEYRFTQITFNLARYEVASLFAAIPGLDVGDFLEIPDPPSLLQPDAVKQLVIGYTETITNFEWSIVFNTVPESPYEGEDLPTW